MQIKVSGKGIELGDSLREFVEKEISSLTEKYIGDSIEASIIISKDNRLFDVEIFLHLHYGFVIKADGKSDDPYRSVSFALERLEERLKKHKNRIRNKHRRTQWSNNSINATKYIVERKNTNADEEHLTIAEQESSILCLSVSEAVMKLDLADVPVVMFKNADSGRINVVYKRPDGHTGWIDYKE